MVLGYQAGKVKRYGDLLKDVELAVEGVPAGRYDNALRTIGLDRLVRPKNARFRGTDIVPRHVERRAKKLQTIDNAFRLYKEQQRQAPVFCENKSRAMLEFLKKDAPEFLPRLRNQDSKMIRDRYILWMGVKRRYHGGQASDAEYHNATSGLEKSLRAYEAVHEHKLAEIEAKLMR
ncbi:hypothetical protein KY337_05040 [Candidatus Woesearchaeota archaeon]|nr:hypothetical protein [Candidatus Woesearchaeota archaeon]